MKVATPAELVVAVVLPPRVATDAVSPVDGAASGAPLTWVMLAVTTTPACCTMLPDASRSWITGWGESTPPLVAVVGGGVVNEGWLAPAALRVNALLIAGTRPVAVAWKVYPAPTLSSTRSEKVATPLTAALVLVPVRVAPPGLEASATVIWFVAPNTVVSRSSCSRTVTGGTSGDPAVALDGWLPNPSRVGGRFRTETDPFALLPSAVAVMVTGPPSRIAITSPAVVTVAVL